MPASYHRAYRARRRAEGRPILHPAGPRRRGDRSAEYRARREARRASSSPPDVAPLVDPLWTAVDAIAPARRIPPGSAFRFPAELMAEDARSVAVLAILEGEDPAAAVARYVASERAWYRLTCSPARDE